jgi:flagellar biosynthetic protein FliR
MDLGSQLASLWQWTPALVLVMARIGALFFTAPLVGGPFVPGRVKTLLTLAISVLVLPTLGPAMPAKLPVDGRYLLMLAQELATGATIGFACTCIFEGVRGGGELINRYAGFTAAENFDPESGVGEGPVGDMLLVGMVMIFLGANAHLELIAVVSTSYAAVPVGAWQMSPQLLHMSASGTDQCMAMACMLSFPVLALSLIHI